MFFPAKNINQNVKIGVDLITFRIVFDFIHSALAENQYVLNGYAESGRSTKRTVYGAVGTYCPKGK